MNSTVPAMTSNEDRKRGVRRSTLWMSLLAFAIYAGFILMAVLRSGQ